MSIGPWWIAVYTLRLGCGICLGLAWLWYAAPLFHIERGHLAKWCWILSLIALASGRVGYGLMHRAYFRQNPLHLFQLRRFGGIHGESALLGGLVGLGIWAACRQKRNAPGKTAPNTYDIQTFCHLLALCAPAILCVTAGAWWGCMQAGCAWGHAVELTDTRVQWLLVNGPDLYHTVHSRYPVQLVGAVWALVTAWAATIRTHQVYQGTLALMLYCIGAAALTFLRGDSIPTIGHVRVDTMENLGIAFFLGGIQLWQILRSRLAS